MLLFMVLKVVKYRIIGETPDSLFLMRYVIYIYWIPQLMLPTMFLMVCIRIRRGSLEKGRWNELLLLLPASILSIAAFTNDIHQLIYIPSMDLSSFSVANGTYTYGLGFYLIYAWMFACWAFGLAILFRVTGRRTKKVVLRLAGTFFLWISLMFLEKLFDIRHLIKPYNTQEIHIFFVLGVYEICIRSRLIPSNENHIGFFEQLGIPVLITDRQFTPVYQSNLAVNASETVMKASLEKPVYPNEDTRLTGMIIRAGYVFWEEDESELHRENFRLESANEILSEENDLIRIEKELKEKKAHLDAQNMIYDRIASELYSRQKRIAELLVTPAEDDAAFRKVLGECCVLNAWCKRKSNLLLLEETQLPTQNRELFLALQESTRYLKYCGVEAAAVGEEMSNLPLSDIHDLYDSFETIIEAWLPYLRRMTVSLQGDGIRLAADTDGTPPLPETVLTPEKKISDDTVFLTLRVRKGGEAA